jgi:hypothetical protein
MFVRLHISEGDFCLEERVLVTKKQMHFAWKCVTMELLKVLFKKFYLASKSLLVQISPALLKCANHGSNDLLNIGFGFVSHTFSELLDLLLLD